MIASKLALAVLLGHLCAPAIALRPEVKLRMSASHEGSCRSCVPLTSQGSHFTVEVMVGTPPQPFTLIADTGSNALILPSCKCQSEGKCSQSGNCLGTNVSNSLNLLWEDSTLPLSARQPVELLLNFGSGQIQGAIATDVASVGNCSADMDDGLLLIVDKQLTIDSFFGGILGLGLPKVEQKQTPSHGSSDDAFSGIIDQIMGGSSGDSVGSNDGAGDHEGADEQQTIPLKVTSFLDQANISHFSMCFQTDGGEGGSLRFNPDEEVSSLATVGQEHWAVDFRGITVGSDHKKLSFCSEEDMTSDDQVSPCAMIPDSGTTMITGPAASLDVLLESVCDNWKLCTENHTAFVTAVEKMNKVAKAELGGMEPPWELTVPKKSSVLKFLLMDCQSWMHSSDAGLDALPPLHFHLQNGDQTHEVQLKGPDYVYEASDLDIESDSDGSLPSWFQVARGVARMASVLQLGSHHKEEEDVEDNSCLPAFQEMDYPTVANGDVWVFGLPLFYKYEVHYGVSVTPPTVGFKSLEDSPCGGCDAAPGLAELKATSASAAGSKLPRKLVGKPRMPQLDTSRAL